MRQEQLNKHFLELSGVFSLESVFATHFKLPSLTVTKHFNLKKVFVSLQKLITTTDFKMRPLEKSRHFLVNDNFKQQNDTSL